MNAGHLSNVPAFIMSMISVGQTEEVKAAKYKIQNIRTPTKMTFGAFGKKARGESKRGKAPTFVIALILPFARDNLHVTYQGSTRRLLFILRKRSAAALHTIIRLGIIW